MKKFFLLLFTIASVSAVSAQKANDCTKFHTGGFRYINEKFKNTEITRTLTKQTEVDKVRNFYAEGDIKWVSDCEYELKYTKVIVNGKNMDPKSKVIFTRLVKIDGDIVTCKSSSGKKALTFAMKKIK